MRNVQIEFTEVFNQRNFLEGELNAVVSQLQKSEETIAEFKGKEDNLRDMVTTMSQEKTLLNNRISQML